VILSKEAYLTQYRTSAANRNYRILEPKPRAYLTLQSSLSVPDNLVRGLHSLPLAE